MSKQTAFIYVVLFSVLLVTGSLNLDAQTTAYSQLRSVNAEWQNQPDTDPALLKIPAKDLTGQQLIQFHLQQTEQLLRERNTNHLTPSQRKNRLANLDILHCYSQMGIFPVNDGHEGRQPYFIDKFNTYCAVGYLMQQTGADEMARDINLSQNYNYLIDITHPGLMNWVYNSGLSLDELALIQPAYGGDWPCVVTELHYNNAGPDVNEYLEVHQHNFSGPWGFQTVRFYDHLGVLYKTLLRNDMQWFSENGNTYYHYLFPANESFADSGRIEFITATAQITSEFHYNSSGITYIDHTPLYGQTKQFSVIEDENVPIGSSLTFCGRYRYANGSSTWNASIIPATIGIINPCVLVPLNLSSFNYIGHNKAVELTWQTSTESNTNQFIVERSSDGINFSPIGTVKAAGTSNSIKQYNLMDNDPGYLNHYRLKQVNLDGSFTYSQVLYVKFLNANPIKIVTNPVNNDLNIQVNSLTANAGILLIYDFHGKQMLQLNAKTGRQYINVSPFPSGKYMLQLQTEDGKIYNQAFIKQ